ncbi:MAG: NADH-quinone oxidoreductase subunit A [Myxococcales bacterium]|nr:NADH-quinone oxidoreductase subunit A [Myxococcales bacterium]MCB9708768.1 NADH-quinone oxidoreductase subunit A [Myxococcales bacterium]
MLATYLPVVMMLGLAVLVAVGMFLATSLLGPKNMTAEKAMPYESGWVSSGAQDVRLSVKFFLTAILFVVFDVEAVFLYPWAVSFQELGWFGFMEMTTFLVVLGLALLYAWRKGALTWAD